MDLSNNNGQIGGLSLLGGRGIHDVTVDTDNLEIRVYANETTVSGHGTRLTSVEALALANQTTAMGVGGLASRISTNENAIETLEDAAGSGNSTGSHLVHTDGAQTITGAKSFSGGIVNTGGLSGSGNISITGDINTFGGQITGGATYGNSLYYHVGGSGLPKNVETELSGKAESTHSHAISDVTGLATALSGKAASSHSHVISDVTGLATALSGKATTTHSHVINDVTNLQSTLDGKATTTHSHAISDVTNLQSTLDGKAVSSHSHVISDVTNLQSTLDTKASTSDVAVAVQALVAETTDSNVNLLNTLTELSTALGNDENFATTVANSIGGKASTVALNPYQEV